MAIQITGAQVRGVLRFERDEKRLRPFFGGILTFAAVCVYASQASESQAPYAFAVAFLVLVATAPFGLHVLNPPRDLNLDDYRLTIGEQELRLEQIVEVSVRTEGAVHELLIRTQDEALQLPLATRSHSEEDVRWLVDAIEGRRG